MQDHGDAQQKNGDAQQFISSKVIANNGDAYSMNNSSNSSVVIAVGKCKKKNKKKKRPSPCNKDTSLFTIDHKSTYKKFYQKGTFRYQTCSRYPSYYVRYVIREIMAAGVMMARAINVSSSDCILIPDQAIMYLKLNSLLQERDNELSSESGKGENETYSEFSQQLVQDITLREQFGESLSSTLTSIVTA